MVMIKLCYDDGCAGGYDEGGRFLVFERLDDKDYAIDPGIVDDYNLGRMYGGAYEIVSEDFGSRTAVARMIDNRNDSCADDILWGLRKAFKEHLDWVAEQDANDIF